MNLHFEKSFGFQILCLFAPIKTGSVCFETKTEEGLMDKLCPTKDSIKRTEDCCGIIGQKSVSISTFSV